MPVRAHGAFASRLSASAFAVDLARQPDLDPASVCYTAALGREHFAAHRLAVAGASLGELREKVAALAAGETVAGALAAAPAPGRRRIAFLFSGQGSQFTGMGLELYEALAVYRDAIHECAGILDPLLGVPLRALLFDEAESPRLHQTRYAQPALFAFEYALFATWRSWGFHPDAVLGHSLGELVAATAAGVLELEDALRLVSERARLMQELPEGGGMLAVAADEQHVKGALGRFPSLSIAAVNGPENVVVSGDLSELAAIAELFKQARVGSVPLHVSHAFHSRRMEPMLAAFEEHAKKFRYAPPAIPLVSNVTGAPFAKGEAPSAGYYARHIRSTVRFADGLRGALHAMDVKSPTVFLELGPATVLTDIGRRSGAGQRDAYVPSLRTRSHPVALVEGVGALYARGFDFDWKRFYAGRERTPVPLATYPFDQNTSGTRRVPRRNRAPRRQAPKCTPCSAAGSRSRFLRSRCACRSRAIDGLATIASRAGRVFPRRADLAMSLAAARAILPAEGRSLAVTDASFGASHRARRRDQLHRPGSRHHGRSRGSLRRYLCREHRGAEVDAAFVLRVAGAAVRDAGAERDVEPWREVLERCRTPVERDELYSRLAASGLEYGPQFRGVAEAWVGDGEAVGRLRAPEGLAPALRQSWLHPAVLDEAFHVVAAAVSAGAAKGTFVPVGMKSLRLERESPRTGDIWVVARVNRAASTSLHLESDLTVYDAAGGQLARIEGLAAEALPTAEAASPAEGLLYRVQWERLELSGQPDPAGLPASGVWIVLARKAVSPSASRNGSDVGRPSDAHPFEQGRRPFRTVRRSGLPEELKRALVQLRRDMPEANAIVNFWTLDAERAGADLESAMNLGPIAVLHITQAIAAAGWDECPRLWVVTAGAVSTGNEEVSVAQAPVSGFCRTLAREHPEMRCTLVDLPVHPGEAQIDLLMDHLSRDSSEQQVALRATGAWVPRLHRSAAGRTARPNAEMAVPRGAFRLDSAQRGVLHSLGLKPAPRRAPRAGEVEIAVRAAGVNFRDVMKALGIYPTASGDVLWYGDECAGEVVEVGDGVTTLNRGDRVVAMAPAAFAEFVITQAAFARPVPEGVSAGEAAALLVAFSTAYYGLCDLARLRRGETGLIHGGAGGVGMAAIQVARDLGAEIFATAGTPARRGIVLQLGASPGLSIRAPFSSPTRSSKSQEGAA